jgi:hypothetical protein
MSYTKALAGGFLFLGLAAGATVARADPIAVTFDPGVVVAGASQFTADTLNLKDYSRVDLTGTTGNFTENGFLEFNNASLGTAAPFNPSGNLSTYSIYLEFNATGTQSLASFNGASTGTINTLSYTLFEAPGTSTFSITGDEPTVTNSGTPVALATGSLIAGSTSFSNSPLGAGANVSATFAQEIAGFIASPTGTTLTLGAAFNNDPNIITVLNGGTAFTLNGGGGDLSFTSTAAPVPEPATLAILGSGLIGLGAIRSRRRKTN